MEDFQVEDLQSLTDEFNRLHSLGIQLLTTLEDEVQHANDMRDKAESDLNDTYAELNDIKQTNKNLSAELAKCQKELELVKLERDELRGKYDSVRLELGRSQKKFDDLKNILTR